MKIRPATIADLESLRKLNTSIFEEVNQACDDDLVAKIAETDAGGKYFKEAITRQDWCFLVAEEKGKIIGFTNGGPKDLFYRRSKYFEIENIGVIPEKRKLGLGDELLKVITEWANKHGFQKIYVMAYAKNGVALNFYKKYGYQEIDIGLEKVI